MEDNNAKNILLKILECDTADKLNNLVESEAYFSEGRWDSYGGLRNNTGIINCQMRDPENSLIEKITNSIDAVLMRKCQEEGVEPRDQSKAPKDMEEAILRYFGGRDEIRKKRSEVAKGLIRLSAIGRKDKLTIKVVPVLWVFATIVADQLIIFSWFFVVAHNLLKRKKKILTTSDSLLYDQDMMKNHKTLHMNILYIMITMSQTSHITNLLELMDMIFQKDV